MRKVLLLILTVILVPSCGSGYKEKGYFKDTSNNRIFTVVGDTSDSLKMFKYGQSKMNTDKRLTKVYFYTNDAEAKNVSVASDLDHAIALGCNDNCAAVYSKYPTGLEELILNPNCGEE